MTKSNADGNSESNLGKRRKSAQAKEGSAYATRREEVLASAEAAFNEEGYDAVTLSDIAKRAGTDRASIYYYASSKEELFHQVTSRMLESNLAEAEDIASRAISPREKLRLIIEYHVNTNTRGNPLLPILIHEMRRVAAAETRWSRDVADKMRRYESIVQTIIEEGIEDGTIRADVTPALATHAIFGMLNWIHPVVPARWAVRHRGDRS
jgi:AcrR family transcriptional regulator